MKPASRCTDSTVLAYVLKLLNERHDYGVELQLLSVDEGITGYRDDSLEVNDITLHNQRQLQFSSLVVNRLGMCKLIEVLSLHWPNSRLLSFKAKSCFWVSSRRRVEHVSTVIRCWSISFVCSKCYY